MKTNNCIVINALFDSDTLLCQLRLNNIIKCVLLLSYIPYPVPGLLLLCMFLQNAKCVCVVSCGGRGLCLF